MGRIGSKAHAAASSRFIERLTIPIIARKAGLSWQRDVNVRINIRRALRPRSGTCVGCTFEQRREGNGDCEEFHTMPDPIS
jgi:hypothetical protein